MFICFVAVVVVVVFVFCCFFWGGGGFHKIHSILCIKAKMLHWKPKISLKIFLYKLAFSKCKSKRGSYSFLPCLINIRNRLG